MEVLICLLLGFALGYVVAVWSFVNRVNDGRIYEMIRRIQQQRK